MVDNAGTPITTTSPVGSVGDAIYVMDPSGRIFVTTQNAQGVFHHSSILAGQDVAAAGHISVVNGRIVSINANSGHYFPTLEHAQQVVTELAARGMDVTHIRVELGY